MATESPMRIVESGRGRNWPSSKDASTFGSPFKNVAAEEFGYLLKGHNIYRDQINTMPNRSGSAPPSMEGSLAAIGNLLAQQDSTLNPTLAGLSSALENCESEEQLLSDPAYFSYYWSNVNLNPRLPPPLMSRENCRLVRHIGAFNNNWRLASLDDSEYLHLSRGSSLSTHNEEPEDDSSAEKTSNKVEEDTDALFSGESIGSTSSRHKSLVDLIQQDFPRTPSPVYNQTLSTSRATTEEGIDRDLHALSLNVSSLNISKLPKPNHGPADVSPEINPPNVQGTKSISDNIPLASSFDTQQCPRGSRIARTDMATDSGVHPGDGVESCTLRFEFSQSQSRSRPSTAEVSSIEQEQQSYGRNMTHLYMPAHQSAPYQLHGVQPSVILPGKNHLATGMENLSQGHPKASSVDVQTPLHSASVSPFLYATSASYMTPGSPFYPNFQPPGLYATQYNIGGYALGSTLFPPFMPGYTSHSALPVPYNAPSGPSFNARTSGVSIAENSTSVGDLQNRGKLYGQSELIFHSSFLDSLNMQFSPRPLVEDPYGGVVQFGPLASRGVSQVQVSPFVSQSETSINAYVSDPKMQSSSNILSISNPRRVSSDNYHGSSSNMGIITQFPVSPLASPVLPSSPVGGMTYFGRRNEVRFSQGSVRTAGPYTGWQNHKSVNCCDETKKHSFLEELKSSSLRKFELSDIVGRIVEFSVDQHGSRFIQQKLEICRPEEKASVFKEVLPHALKLMTDVFGNYVIQKFFEYGTPEQRKELADQLSGQILPLSLQMYGCRVIQKALEVIELDQKTLLVRELDGHVMRCVHDQNGNHVIQKCIECIPTQNIEFIISSFRGQVATLSTHPYGCRVIQRVLEHCSDQKVCQCIIDEILESACVLAQDQYGNYVTQHVLERGKPYERSQIIGKVFGKVLEMSQHKYASNVVEKCLEHGNTHEQELLIEEIIGQSEENDNLLAMMKDQFANYVVQKILETSNDKQREILLSRIRAHLHGLKKYTYGKHIVARFEQLAGEGSQAIKS